MLHLAEIAITEPWVRSELVRALESMGVPKKRSTKKALAVDGPAFAVGSMGFIYVKVYGLTVDMNKNLLQLYVDEAYEETAEVDLSYVTIIHTN